MGLRYKACLHCKVEFLPNSKGQSYCSEICRVTARNMRKKPLPEYGPCPTCKNMFVSKRPKVFCSIKCYTSSPEFLERIRSQASKALAASLRKQGLEPVPRIKVKCLECDIEFFRKPSDPNHKFCCFRHYRAYMAKRFDRHIASPESIALPQNYDEFLTQTELPCLIEGCKWVGENLGNHINFSHGIIAKEFKRAAGFNLKTGLVTPEVSEKLSSRPHLYMSNFGGQSRFELGHQSLLPETRNYHSLEAREHASKGRALKMETSDPPFRTCKGCGKSFQQGGPFGLTKFCSRECRQQFYNRNHRRRTCACAYCNNEFLASYYQTIRNERKQPVFCSHRCRCKYWWDKERVRMAISP